MGSKVALRTAWLILPPTTWYLRPSISAHSTQRRRISAGTWRVKLSRAS